VVQLLIVASTRGKLDTGARPDSEPHARARFVSRTPTAAESKGRPACASEMGRAPCRGQGRPRGSSVPHLARSAGGVRGASGRPAHSDRAALEGTGSRDGTERLAARCGAAARGLRGNQAPGDSGIKMTSRSPPEVPLLAHRSCLCPCPLSLPSSITFPYM
jgi:hypothetical protein